MIWFNRDKSYGFVRTEDEERLYVARDGFVPEHVPSCSSTAMRRPRLVPKWYCTRKWPPARRAATSWLQAT